MSAFATGLLALGAAGIIGAACDRWIAFRSPTYDRGEYWTRVTRALVFSLGPVLLLSSWSRALVFAVLPDASGLRASLESFEAAWGWFPFVESAGRLGSYGYGVAFSIPLVWWFCVLVVALRPRPGGDKTARGIAGGVGFTSSRSWVLMPALPFAVLLLVTGGDLDRGRLGYPAPTWTSVGVVALSLVGVSMSRGRSRRRPPLWPAAGRPEIADSLGRTWPEVLAERGVRAEFLFEWSAESPLGHPRSSSELMDVVASQFGPGGSQDARPRLVFAPDDCGQAEAVGLASSLLAERSQSVSLVVTAAQPELLTRRLAAAHPLGPDRVGHISSTGELPSRAMLCVIDAQTLSDALLPRLRDPAYRKRIGLVVWWQLEQFTGVLGANLWAISRRLDRLLTMRKGPPAKTLAFARAVRFGDEQIERFVQRLLPYDFARELQVHLPSRQERSVRAYLLESDRGGPEQPGMAIGAHPALAAAQASFEAGYATRLERPSKVSGAEMRAFVARSSGPADRFDTLSSRADVRILELEAADVLSITELLTQGGRGGHANEPHCVGLVLLDNPYVRFLVKMRAQDEDLAARNTSRRLVCAEANAHIIRSHILSALNEHADTRSGLLKTFLWDETALAETLDRLDRDQMLKHEEVRFLDSHDQPVIEPRYASRNSNVRERRPLDTVGSYLVPVRDEAEGSDGVRMWVDPERLCIEAYPHRVFFSGGQRYRVREWNDPEAVIAAGAVRCTAEGSYCSTWRVRAPSVAKVRAFEGHASIKRGSHRIERLIADLEYHEEVSGSLRVDLDPASGRPRSEPVETAFRTPIRQRFETRGLVLCRSMPIPIEQTASVAHALRYVLPVHLGVDQNALEVVPLYGAEIEGEESYGLVIVDLYPGGIGLIDAIHDDGALPLALLGFTRDWLERCPCESERGCDLCLQTLSTRAASSEHPVFRSSALSLLRELV